MKLIQGFWQRLLLLIMLFVAGIILTGGIQYLLTAMSDKTIAVLRISVVCQNLLAFIIPAVLTAVLITRLPADFLKIRKLPPLKPFLICLGLTIAVQPLIEGVNWLSQQLPWPDEVLALEAQAEAAVKALIGAPTPGNIIISILIIGVLAGLGEELFFRGAMQNIFASHPMSAHLAIWLTAMIFSLMHGQMVGFVPRMLLGAGFGYAVRWTGSTWTAVCCHVLNNTLAVLFL